MEWVDYDGQETTGYDYIGTEELMYPLGNVKDIEDTVKDIRRRCGKFADIKLFKEVDKYASRGLANC